MKKPLAFVAPLLGLLLTVLIVVIGIAVPNLLNAFQRARQKRTMGDLRSVGTAAESYSIDFHAYPPSAAGSIPVLYGGLAYPTATLGGMARYLTPTYLKALPLADGWDSWFLYTAGNRNQDYALVSAGSDGVARVPATSGPTTSFETDIVFSDGQFTVYPEGVCQ